MEIVVRAVVVFLFLWLVTRIVGRSTIGELSTFQLIVFITMGDLVQQAVTQQDYSITAAVLAVSVFTLLTVVLSWMNSRWPAIRRFTHGRPVIVMDDGVVDRSALRRERISIDDLKAAARRQGIESLIDVRLAVLEATGQISFFQQAGHSGAADPPAAGS